MGRILHISKYYYPFAGGIEQIARDCVNALKGEHEQIIIAFSENKNDERIYVDEILVYKCGCNIKIASQPISISYRRILKKIIEEFNPDIIIFHYPNPFVASILLSILKKKTNIKLVTYWHCDIVKQKVLGKLFYKQNNEILQKSYKIIATSPNYIQGSKWLQQVKDKCVVIPNCINTKRMEITPDIEEKAKKIRLSNTNKTICLAVGRHTEYKGFEYLIKASKLLTDDYIIYITGSGELTNKLHKEAEGDLKIQFTGKVDDDELKALLLACDIFCFPSITKNEAFGVALAEAMYYGKPAITFNIEGSGVNYVNLNNITGIEVENKCVAQYAKAILDLSNNKQLINKLGYAAKNRVEKLFLYEDYKKNIKEYIRKWIMD